MMDDSRGLVHVLKLRRSKYVFSGAEDRHFIDNGLACWSLKRLRPSPAQALLGFDLIAFVCKVEEQINSHK